MTAATLRERLESAYALTTPEIRNGERPIDAEEQLAILEEQVSATLGVFRELHKMGQDEILRSLIRAIGLEDEPVNWAALGYCEAEFDPNSGWTILTVTEASPEAGKFAGWLEDTLAAFGWYQVEVVCEW